MGRLNNHDRVTLSAYATPLIIALSIAVPAYSQTADSSFLPLEIGNAWTMAYVLDHPFQPWDTLTAATFEVSDRILLDSTEYTLMSPSKGFMFADTIRTAVDGNIYSMRNGIEQLLFDFTAVGDSAYTYPFDNAGSDYYVRVETNVTIKTFVGTFDNCISFYFDVPEAIDEELSYTFAPGVGLVAFGGAWSFGWLYSGQVGDRAYVTGIDDVTEQTRDIELVSIHPNPVADQITIRLQTRQSTNATIDVFDVQGRRVRTSSLAHLPSGQNDVKIDVTNLAAGLYSARISTASMPTSFQAITFVVSR